MTCKTCNSTGFIVTRNLVFDRPRFDKELGELVLDYCVSSDWMNTICPDCCDDYIEGVKLV